VGDAGDGRHLPTARSRRSGRLQRGSPRRQHIVNQDRVARFPPGAHRHRTADIPPPVLGSQSALIRSATHPHQCLLHLYLETQIRQSMSRAARQLHHRVRRSAEAITRTLRDGQQPQWSPRWQHLADRTSQQAGQQRCKGAGSGLLQRDDQRRCRWLMRRRPGVHQPIESLRPWHVRYQRRRAISTDWTRRRAAT
jgi:hypothetical protein